MSYYKIIDKKVEKYISKKLSVNDLSIKSNNNIISILDKPSKSHGKCVKSSNDAIKKRDKCYNEINNCEQNKLIIKKYFNDEIKDFFKD